MIILGISVCHNSSASLMINGEIKGIIQEERLTKIKNQAGFPLKALQCLVEEHLDGNYNVIDTVVSGSNRHIPYYFCLDKYTNYDVQDHIKEMNEVWYPYFMKIKNFDGEIWKKIFKWRKN